MGYRRIALLLSFIMLLTGCAGRSGQTPDGDAAVGDSEPDGTSVSEDGAGQGEYVYSEKTVIDAENGGGLVYRAGKGETVFGAAGSSDTLFLLTYCDDASMPFTLKALDKSGSARASVSGENVFPMAGVELDLTTAGMEAAALFEDMEGVEQASAAPQEIDAFPALISGEQIGYYQGKLYIIYYTYEDDRGVRNRYAYCYERQPDGSYAKSQDALCKTMIDLYEQGYLFCGAAQDLFDGLNEYGRLLAWKEEEAKVCAFAEDGSILWEKPVDPAIINFIGTDGRFLLGVNSMLDANERKYFIYDLEGTFADGSDVKEGTYVWSDGSCLGVRGGYLYFYRYNKTAFNRNQYYFYRCRLQDADAKEELLYETQDVAGQPRQREGNNGAAGFTVQGEACYFMDFDGESLWWFACDLSDNAYALTRLDVVDEYHGIFDAGEITYATDSYRCGDCGELVYEYYLEGIRLYGDGDPVTDRINEALTEETDAFLASMEERMQTYQARGTGEDHACGSYTYRTTLERGVDGVTWYRFQKEGQGDELLCLEVDYSGYDYSGGSHGYPWRSHTFFDLSDGSGIGMEALIGIGEEEFCALAAEYTVADYLGENGALYFETQEDELYQTVYEDAGFFDSGVGDGRLYLGTDGVVIEYAPYFLGPYGAGTIEVTVPYDELGLELLEIYGVNE